jgi:hypothetical protein
MRPILIGSALGLGICVLPIIIGMPLIAFARWWCVVWSLC